MCDFNGNEGEWSLHVQALSSPVCWLTSLFKHFPSFLTKDTHFPSVSANNDFYRLYLSGHPLIYIQRCLSFLALKPVMWYGGCFVYHISMDDIYTVLYGRAQTPSLLLGLSISLVTYFKMTKTADLTLKESQLSLIQRDSEVADSFQVTAYEFY